MSVFRFEQEGLSAIQIGKRLLYDGFLSQLSMAKYLVGSIKKICLFRLFAHIGP